MDNKIISEDELKQAIKDEVLKSILIFIKNYKVDQKRSTHPLDLLIKKERKVRSIVGGIETSMGRTLWEPLAKRLALLNGFEVLDKKLKAPAHGIDIVGKQIDTCLIDRTERTGLYNAISTRDAIQRVCSIFIKNRIPNFRATTKGQGVDIWLWKNDIHYLFDTKTVQPNIDKFNRMLEQLMKWYAYFYMEHPDEQVICRIVFPYNPYGKNNFWIKSKGGGKPLEPGEEAWVGNEFWDFISGYEGTLEIIYDCFKEIESEGTLNKKFKKLFE